MPAGIIHVPVAPTKPLLVGNRRDAAIRPGLRFKDADLVS